MKITNQIYITRKYRIPQYVPIVQWYEVFKHVTYVPQLQCDMAAEIQLNQLPRLKTTSIIGCLVWVSLWNGILKNNII